MQVSGKGQNFEQIFAIQNGITEAGRIDGGRKTIVSFRLSSRRFQVDWEEQLIDVRQLEFVGDCGRASARKRAITGDETAKRKYSALSSTAPWLGITV